MSGSTIGQAILAIIESDLANVAGQPVLNLLTTLQASKGNLLMEAAAIQSFIGSAPALGLTLAAELEGQILELAIGKIKQYIAAKGTAAPPPAA